MDCFKKNRWEKVEIDGSWVKSSLIGEIVLPGSGEN